MQTETSTKKSPKPAFGPGPDKIIHVKFSQNNRFEGFNALKTAPGQIYLTHKRDIGDVYVIDEGQLAELEKSGVPFEKIDFK